MKRREFIGTGIGALVGCTLGSRAGWASSGASDSPYNVLFVHTDQWRAQAMGYRNEDPVITPHLDAFQRDSVTFDRAVACSPVCSPNRACWFTGRYPQNHGVYRNNSAHVQPEQLLSRQFKAGGFRNGYIGKWHLNGPDSHRKWNGVTPEFLRSDYDYWTSAIHNHAHFSLRFEEDGEVVNYGEGWQPDHVTGKAIEFLKQQDNRPFNLVVSYGPPHNGSYHPKFCPEKRHTPGNEDHKESGYGYYAPQEYEALYEDLDPLSIRSNIRTEGFGDQFRGAVKGYLGSCTAIDDSFGKLIRHLKQSGLYEKTIIVFTSDHGEMMGSHNLMTKGVPFEESLRVPMLMRVPGAKPYVDNRVFNSVDLMPTLMGLTGLDIPSGVDGKDFSKSIGSDKQHLMDPELAYIGFAAWRGFRTKRYSYVSGARNDGGLSFRERNYLREKRPEAALNHMLFDLENDPYQLEPILKGDGRATDALIDDFQQELIAQLTPLGENHLVPQSL